MINALNYPEILLAVGEHIPVFKHGSEGIAISYTPETMLACCLVSKFWRQVFLPFLWREHDSQLMLRRVPLSITRQYSNYVRVFRGSNREHPPLFTQLSEMTLELNFDPAFAIKLLSASTKLKRLTLGCPGFTRAMSKEVRRIQTEIEIEIEHASPTMNESEDQGVGASPGAGTEGHCRQIPDVIFEPLANFGATLQELHLRNMAMAGSDLLRLLSPVAKGSLEKMTLWRLSGTSDLEDLVFVNVVWLDFKFDYRQPVEVEEIIGRCPSLKHLTLNDYDCANAMDRVVLILQGTQKVERERDRVKREKEGKQRQQWSRPQLSTLRIDMDLLGFPDNPSPTVSHTNIVALIKACSNLDNGIRSGYQGSLRELSLAFSTFQNEIGEAIKYHSSSLEVLRIKTKQDELDATLFNQKQRTRVLCKVLKSCRRLRVFEFQDFSNDADVSRLMEDLMERPSESQDGRSGMEQDMEGDIGMWGSPNLESLMLKATGYLEHLLEEKERLYLVDEGNGKSREWVMPTQKWDPRSKDGTDALLDARWNSFQIFEEVEEEATGDELIRRFLRHIAPSKKLKSLQLGQLNFFCRQSRKNA